MDTSILQSFFSLKKQTDPFYNLTHFLSWQKTQKKYKKRDFSEKKVVCHATDISSFPTITIFYMYEQPKPFLMIFKKLKKPFFA